MADDIPFRDKLPQVVWRGNLTGEVWTSPFGGDPALPGLPANADAPLSASSPRLRAVQMSLRDPDLMNCRFALPSRSRQTLQAPIQSPFLSQWRPTRWLLQFKYQLCIPGYDIATQLYWVINTNSLALKVQCDFEVIPDFHLRPWVHYVPIAADLHDLHDKVAYCQANPDTCLAIIDRAKQAYARIVQRAPWEEAELTVLDRLGWLGTGGASVAA